EEQDRCQSAEPGSHYAGPAGPGHRARPGPRAAGRPEAGAVLQERRLAARRLHQWPAEPDEPEHGPAELEPKPEPPEPPEPAGPSVPRPAADAEAAPQAEPPGAGSPGRAEPQPEQQVRGETSCPAETAPG